MKYSINNYVNALASVLDEVSDKEKSVVLANFVKMVDKNGDMTKRDKIIEAVHRKTVAMNGGKWITVELARELPEPKLRIIREAFSDTDYINFKINPVLVAGIRITINGEKEMDNSLQNKLKKLFSAKGGSASGGK